MGLTLLAGLTPAAAADVSTLLGVSKSWSAYQMSTSDGKVCFAMSTPKSTDPKKTVRDPMGFLVSDWPDRKAKAELQVVPGYQYQDGSKVTAQAGKAKVEFFTKNDGGSGNAWIEDMGDEGRLLDAMSHASQLVVTGISQRGTKIKDTYSLVGLKSALGRIHTACGL
jgi:hypothetical protein